LALAAPGADTDYGADGLERANHAAGNQPELVAHLITGKIIIVKHIPGKKSK